MDKILITGGTGFVGYWMKETMPPGITLTTLNRWTYEHTFWDAESWDYVEHWDYVVHLAPISPNRVLNCDAKRILYASSGAAYNQTTQYADDKRRWEAECLQSRRDVVIARLFTFYGERLDQGKAIVQFVKAAKAGKPIRIWGDGKTVRSYMHGEKMGRWLWALLYKGEAGQIYDVGDDKPVTMLDLAYMVNRAFGNRSPIVMEFKKEICTRYLPTNTAKTRKVVDSFYPAN